MLEVVVLANSDIKKYITIISIVIVNTIIILLKTRLI